MRPSDTGQDQVEVDVFTRQLLVSAQDRLAGGLEHALEAAQHRERQDYAAVLALLERTTQQVCYGPNEGRMITG